MGPDGNNSNNSSIGSHKREGKGGKRKKRKREEDGDAVAVVAVLDTSKPTAVFKPTMGGGRKWTLSVAVPGSIIANAQTHELKTQLAGHIARALAVFCVDEVVVYDDTPRAPNFNSNPSPNSQSTTPANPSSYTGLTSPSHFLTHLLAYLETPPYLRRHLFPLHPNLRFAGQLPSLDMPHHLRGGEWSAGGWREGVAIGSSSGGSGGYAGGEGKKDKYANKKEKRMKKKKEKEAEKVEEEVVEMEVTVDAGLDRNFVIKTTSPIPPSTRLTLRLPLKPPNTTPIPASPAHPSHPRTTEGYYWGYTTRLSPTLSAVFTQSPFPGGYTLSIGTSERGRPLSHYTSPTSSSPLPPPAPDQDAHIVVVFGGLAGLEAAVGADEELRGLGVGAGDARDLFDWWVDVCPGQGSRTIRTEEAVWVGLAGVRAWLVGGLVGE